MKLPSTCDIVLIFSVINLSLSQFHSRYPHKVRYRRNNRLRQGNISPRILNKETPIVSDGFHSPPQFQQQASRRIDIVSEASFVPSKTVNFDPDFQSIEDIDNVTSETKNKPVVFRNERLSNPLQFKSSKSSGWNGQSISKYSAEGSDTDQTIGEKSNLNEETIITLLRENPRRYMFWPEDTSNKPDINVKTIENNVQAKVDIAEDRIWTEDLDEVVGDSNENVFIVPKVSEKSVLGEIKAEPIILTTTTDNDFDENLLKSQDSFVTHYVSNDKEASSPENNDSPLKIESFFNQLSNKNSVINDFSNHFSNEGSSQEFLLSASTKPFTTTSSSTTESTLVTAPPTTTTTTTTTATTTTATSTTTTSLTTTTSTTTTTIKTTTTDKSSTTTKVDLGIESFFGQLQEASSSALKGEISLPSEDKVSSDQDEVFLGTSNHDATLNQDVDNSLLSRDENQHHQAEIIETLSLNNTGTILTPGSQNDVKFAENNNTAVNLEEEEIRTTIEDLVEETTVFTITNDSTTVPEARVTSMTPEAVTPSTTRSVTTKVTRRLPSRYMNTRTRSPPKARPPTASTSPPSVINHNMNLQTALIINTLSKVLPNVPQSRLKNQPRLESVGSGVTFHQEEIFIFHTTLTELHAILDKSLRKGGLPSDLMVSIFAAKEHTIALVHLFYRLLMEAEFREDKSVTISKVDSRDFAKHFHFLRAIFPFL